MNLWVNLPKPQNHDNQSIMDINECSNGKLSKVQMYKNDHQYSITFTFPVLNVYVERVCLAGIQFQSTAVAKVFRHAISIQWSSTNGGIICRTDIRTYTLVGGLVTRLEDPTCCGATRSCSMISQ